jgi:hypothetical protein
MFEGEEDGFVCVGCGEPFFLNIATRCAPDDDPDEKLFHSAACMTAWNERQP